MKKKRFVLVKRLGWCLGVCAILTATCATAMIWKHLPSPGAVAAKVQRDVVYCRTNGVDLKLDVYYPPAAGTAPLPVVMYVHGGGWRMGSKSMLAMMPGPSELLRRGYLVMSINYRLAPEYKFPAMLADVQAAVRFLRANAKTFNLDPNRVGVMGDSAGGHLVALLALVAVNTRDDSTRVQAVVDLYGPTDFTSGDKTVNKTTIKLLQDAFGATSADDPVLKRASPVMYISGNAPPFLILHGDHDRLVDIKQSAELNARLQAAGDESTFVVITNFAHGYTPLGLRSTPDTAALSKMVADFFDRHLRQASQ